MAGNRVRSRTRLEFPPDLIEMFRGFVFKENVMFNFLVRKQIVQDVNFRRKKTIMFSLHKYLCYINKVIWK